MEIQVKECLVRLVRLFWYVALDEGVYEMHDHIEFTGPYERLCNCKTGGTGPKLLNLNKERKTEYNCVL